ncbi:hypothetical protein SBI67_14370 [Mycolicibacterium sp. 120266]|nr:hypothetical protein [Mycolicibacterium sp. 120266]MDX1873305.1 hypothetical protein [Mycolicibacterium sp. 120266]
MSTSSSALDMLVAIGDAAFANHFSHDSKTKRRQRALLGEMRRRLSEVRT